jgi:hypothetical protein
MEPFIAEHAGHLLGVLDLHRYQAEASRDDRGALVERAHVARSLRSEGASNRFFTHGWRNVRKWGQRKIEPATETTDAGRPCLNSRRLGAGHGTRLRAGSRVVSILA